MKKRKNKYYKKLKNKQKEKRQNEEEKKLGRINMKEREEET